VTACDDLRPERLESPGFIGERVAHLGIVGDDRSSVAQAKPRRSEPARPEADDDDTLVREKPD
jgi:hypothetical protein